MKKSKKDSPSILEGILWILFKGILPITCLWGSCCLFHYWKMSFQNRIWGIKPFPLLEIGLLIGATILLIGLWLIVFFYEYEDEDSSKKTPHSESWERGFLGKEKKLQSILKKLYSE